MRIRFKVLLLVLVGGFTAMDGSAQKLPSVQQGGLRAPANIKVDGKADEWGNKYKAFDTRNNIFYTISNNDQSLFLTIHTNEPNAVNKIYVGGITFIINSLNHTGTPISITYPIIKAINNGVYLHAKHDYDEYKKDSLVNADNIKALILLKNQQFDAAYKELKASGIKEFNDPVLSVYNTEGLKVRALFDNSFAYTYELALPLKYLEDALGGLDKLRYTIKLNGSYREGNIHPPPSPPHTSNPDGSEHTDMNQLYISTPTDFGGEYSIAKK